MQAIIYKVSRTALPNVNRPNVDRTLNAIGTGFLNLIARGIEEPPRIMEATRDSSAP